MSKEFTPHDLFFSKLMEDKEMARDLFLSYFPPAVQKYIDLSTAELEHLNPKFVNDVLSGYKVCDVLYKTTSKEKDCVTLLLAHAEHLSHPDKTIALRAICYALLAVLDYHLSYPNDPIPPILSLVYYNGEKPYAHSMDPLALFGEIPDEIKEYVLFRPILIDLNRLSDQEFKDHGKIAPFETLFKHSHDKNDDQKIQIFSETIEEIPRSLLVAALQYMLSCIEKSKKEAFLQMISTRTDERTFQSIADSFIEEGIEKGIKKGKHDLIKILLSNGVKAEFIAEKTGIDIVIIKKVEADFASEKH